jgi:iron complex outermembrane receptor protein
MKANRSARIGIVVPVLAAALVVLGVTSPLLAQGTGRIIGTVTDADTNEGVANVQISIEGTGLGAVSGQRGTYSIPNVPSGSQTLVFNILGYETRREVVTVRSGETAVGDVALVEGFLEMGTITVVGASRQPSRIVEAPAAVSVVTGAELQAEAPTGQLPKLFADKPGIDVVQSGVQDFNINARGYNSSLNRRVLVLQDGIDRSLGFLQSQEWTAISMPLDDLGKLDFVRGPGSALYGANAFSGVLNITTPSPADIQGTKVAVSGGERETARFDVRHAGVSGSQKWGYKANLGHVQVGETFSESRTVPDAEGVCAPPPSQCAFEYGPLPTEAVALLDDPVSSTYGGGRLDYNFDNGSVWTAEGGLAHVENEIFVTGIGRVQINGADRPWVRSQYASDRFVAMGWYSGRRADEVEGNPEAPLPPAGLPGRPCFPRETCEGNNQTSLASGAQLLEKSDIFHVEGQANWSSGDRNLFLVGGASNRWYSVDTEETLMEEAQDDVITSAFAQAEWQLHPKWNLLVAGRFDHFSVIDDDKLAPKGALVFTPTPDHSLRFTYNRAYQVPNYSELFLRVAAGQPADLTPLELGIEAAISQQVGAPIDLPLNFGITTVQARGNEDLEVEELSGFEWGYKGSLAGGRVFLTADYYNNQIEDFVTDLLPNVNRDDFPAYQLPAGFGPGEPFAPFAPAVLGAIQQALGPRFGAFSLLPDGSEAFIVSYTNAGQVDEQGVELGVSFLPAANWQVDANYTYFDFEIDDNRASEGGIVNEDELSPNTPQHKGNIGATYSNPERFSAGFNLHVQEAFDWAAGVFAGPVPGYATLDLNGSWSVAPFARINVAWNNVLDKEHYQLYGGSVLGSRAVGGVTFTF